MIAFNIEVEAIEAASSSAASFPEKNTFIHFEDADTDVELPPRNEATCPDLLLRRAFRTKTFLARRQQRKLEMHAAGDCRPCAYFALKADGCRLGDDCSHCHLCTRKDIRKWKKSYAAKKLAASS
eukprot:TRINITY_DN4406_c0_g3_i1.p1 TRINITY_DN4406_c0_g3~~TRINITY_DN4406_c0_g3_i1.p1  ORF type:complete len:125 (+),score=43.15 TRINITY_DN4406_c0_g3_i1:73-447(+)